MEKRYIASVFLLMSFVLGLITTVLLFIDAAATSYDYFAREYMLSAVLNLVFCIGAIVGVVFALAGTSWGLSIAGSVLGILATGPYFLGSICGLVALILIAVSRAEFAQVRRERGRERGREREREMRASGGLVDVNAFGEPIGQQATSRTTLYGDETRPGYRPPPY